MRAAEFVVGARIGASLPAERVLWPKEADSRQLPRLLREHRERPRDRRAWLHGKPVNALSPLSPLRRAAQGVTRLSGATEWLTARVVLSPLQVVIYSVTSAAAKPVLTALSPFHSSLSPNSVNVQVRQYRGHDIAFLRHGLSL